MFDAGCGFAGDFVIGSGKRGVRMRRPIRVQLHAVQFVSEPEQPGQFRFDHWSRSGCSERFPHIFGQCLLNAAMSAAFRSN